MSKIKVFVKADGVTPSSFMVPGGRVMHPVVPTGKRPIISAANRWCIPCEEHDELTPSVVLDTYAFNAADKFGSFLGPRRYCFFCWMPTENLLKNRK